jgi:glycine/D-amino acid oxidase-like deaminating enzyme
LPRHLPGVSPRVTEHAVCLYTMSPDEHFIVDRHPAHANVFFAAGLSGHGFKFAPVLGRALADLAVEGGTDLAIEFLSLARFASPEVAIRRP